MMDESTQGPHTAAQKLFGRDVKMFRESVGLSQKELAELTGIPSGTWATWESRKEKMLSGPATVCLRILLAETAELRGVREKTLKRLAELKPGG